MTAHRPAKKGFRALGIRFKPTDVLNPQAALAREAVKATGRMLQSERDGDNRSRRNAVRVSPRTREQFGQAPTDVLLKKLRVLIATAPELEEDDQLSGVFDSVTDWMDDAGLGDPEEAAQTFKKLARQGRRSELNQIFEHTVRTMAAAEESIQTRHPNTRSRLDTAYARLQQFGRDCVTLQAQTAGEVITILSERVGGAMAKLGEGAGSALASLMGGTPREMFNDWSLLVVAVGILGVGALATGAFALSTPGGTAAAGSLGKAAGSVAAAGSGAVGSAAKLLL